MLGTIIFIAVLVFIFTTIVIAGFLYYKFFLKGLFIRIFKKKALEKTMEILQGEDIHKNLNDKGLTDPDLIREANMRRFKNEKRRNSRRERTGAYQEVRGHQEEERREQPRPGADDDIHSKPTEQRNLPGKYAPDFRKESEYFD